MKISAVALLSALSSIATTNAYVAPVSVSKSRSSILRSPTTFTNQCSTPLLVLRSESQDGAEAVFVPPAEEAKGDALDQAEKLGRGSAKAKRGKRKGKTVDPAKAKTAASLAPEDVFYEGPPAITETIVPTVSILTVVGIIPAAAAWARQAWVRYKITSRRVRVTSGVGGNEMSEIIYPDIVEMRTVRRLFGDGDLVAFLRDGAKFEMRNIPNFDETMEYILKQVDKDVAEEYRNKGKIE
mmetsp:Transcript_10718/g.13258  ORF Transcript_10718/g.13258 Transcript_10718/m.13258 type:complete len:240 (-) Transcript_10718:178-897(-)|eukprot:CAMPEP_0172487596 /NCGR_PEP_ID=MMETSP1066-20121228/16728_1 /TAXON_ID=671091 /ORGANISM="Coscinodiscus wailesii, Strain CCMP2513" /LENGTH=239 /DNA_ID=CAMNT_0013254301 /DNA_START=111 /DNA_END=830 /DNA_ORIENTATION=+